MFQLQHRRLSINTLLLLNDKEQTIFWLFTDPKKYIFTDHNYGSDGMKSSQFML